MKIQSKVKIKDRIKTKAQLKVKEKPCNNYKLKSQVV